MPARSPVDRAVVLAGGGGTRLWPWTGPGSPKPLLPLGGRGRTLLRAALERLDGLVGPGEISVQASPSLAPLLVAAEPGVRVETEPSPRDTAAAVALAMARVSAERPDAVVAVLPADQRVVDEGAFRESVTRAGALARDGALVLLAVPPRAAVTRFGYVECGAARDGDAPPGTLAVRRFVEKPDAGRAARYAASGRHFWNAGIFVWRADAFATALARHAPEVTEGVRRTVEGDPSAWECVPQTSIDYALLEKASGLAAVRLEAGWDDVGSWDAILPIVDECVASGSVVRLGEGTGARGGSVVLAVGGREQPGPPRLPARSFLLVVYGPSGTLVTSRSVVAPG